MADEKVKRTWVYLQPPTDYGMGLCAWGHPQPQWSEFKRYLWCPACKIDFQPENAGVFDGPIPINTVALMGMHFTRFILATGKIEELKDYLGREDAGQDLERERGLQHSGSDPVGSSSQTGELPPPAHADRPL